MMLRATLLTGVRTEILSDVIGPKSDGLAADQ